MDDLPIEYKNNHQIWIRLGLGAILAWVVYLIFFLPAEPPEADDDRVPKLQGTGRAIPLDYDYTLQDLEGKPVKLADFRGKPMFINIWATWCGPCLAELPSIQKLAANPKWKELDLVFLAISTDEDPAALKRFLKTNPITGLTVLRAVSRPPAAIMSEGIPGSFLIDRQGIVTASVIGAAEWDHPSVVDFLEKLSAKP